MCEFELSAAVANGCANNLATHPPNLATLPPDLATHHPNLAAHPPDLATHPPDLARVDVSPTDVSPAENSWMLHPLNKASRRYCAPDRCVPTLDCVKHGTSSLGRPPAPNGSVGRLAGFA